MNDGSEQDSAAPDRARRAASVAKFCTGVELLATLFPNNNVPVSPMKPLDT